MIRLFLVSIFFIGCSTFRGEQGFQYPESELAKDRIELELGLQSLKQKDYKKAQEILEQFRERRTTSPLLMKAHMGLADAYHQLGQSTQALGVLRLVRDTSLQRSRVLAARSSYQMSFIFEDLGQLDQAIAALNEAENIGKTLQEQIFKIEIPARKAVLFAKLGQRDEAKIFMTQALRGVESLRLQQNKRSPQQEADLLLAMGKVSTQSQAGDTWESRLQVLELIYPLLYRVILLQAEPQSSQARQMIYNQYQALFNLIHQVDIGARASRQQAMGFEVFLQKAAMYRTESAPQGAIELFQLEDDLRKRLSQLVFSNESDMPLTPDSKLRLIKLEGYRLIDPDLVEQSELRSAQDPNL